MKTRTLSIITFLMTGLTLISCLLSILHNDIYQDGEWANAQWLGQDFVTLIIALPLLLISHFKGIKGEDIKWKMVYSGALLYYVYTYSFFMFAANLTVLYLFHLPIYGLSVIGLFIAMMDLFSTNERYSFDQKGLKWTIIIYLIFISVMVSFLWLNDIFAHLTDPSHQSGTPDGKAPLIIYSLDLGIIIPLMITAAISLYKNRPWGLLLNGIILTKTSTLGFALMAMALSMYIQQLNPEPFLIFLWCVLGIIGTTLTILYLRKLDIEVKGA